MKSQFLLKALFGVAVTLFLFNTAQAEIWIKDPTTGCEVWSGDDGSANEVMTWTGSCEEGKAVGLGVLVVHDREGLAVIYNGEMIKGKANGAGSLKFRSEETGEFDQYIGRFEDSKPKGNGIYYSSEGWSFQAYFNGSFDSGDGTLRVEKDEAIIRGRFVDGELIGSALASYSSKSGEYYFGDIENGHRHGVGTLVHANDDAYLGDFDNGVASGVGAFEAADGSVVVGQFANGAPNGAGTYIAPNGDSYQGIFTDGKAEGKVLVTKTDGTQSVENWKNGERQE
jgi:hypothetical protein